MPPVWRARPLIAGRQAKNWRVLKSSRIRIVAKNRNGRNTLKRIIATLAALLSPCLAAGQKASPPSPAQVAQAVREYRMENEDRIVRELSEFLAIPNVASDTPNIQKNAAHLVEMLEARGIETHPLPVTGRGPIVALLAALDALRVKRIPLAVNLKVIFEGEEEAGSPNLQKTLELHKNLLGADLLVTADGPVHQSGRPLVFFGNRGDIGIDLTV